MLRTIVGSPDHCGILLVLAKQLHIFLTGVVVDYNGTGGRARISIFCCNAATQGFADIAVEVEFTDHSSREVSCDLSIVDKVYPVNFGIIVDKDVILHVFIWWETHSNQCGNSN